MTFIGCATRDDVTGDPFYDDGGDDGDGDDGGDMCQGLGEVLNV